MCLNCPLDAADKNQVENLIKLSIIISTALLSNINESTDTEMYQVVLYEIQNMQKSCL